MTINGINGVNTQMGQIGMNQTADSYSRNLQNQIAKAQKQLQELSSKEDMTLEEKMKKRQELQQQINDFNMQLRQHQMEQRRAKQQAQASDSTKKAENTKAEGKSTGLSQASMTAMISADSSLKQAKVQGSVATEMKARTGVLKSEIKLDKARGIDTQAKEEELAEVEQKAQAATASQLTTLADASKTMKEAAKTDNQDRKTTGEKEEASKEDRFNADAIEETESRAENVNTQSDNIALGSTQAVETATASQPTASVDIRL